MKPQIERVLDAVEELLTPEQIESLINIWSMRPQPGTELGEAWERGAKWAWDIARSHLEPTLRAPELARRWISVEDAMPPSGLRVMFTWKNSLGKRRTALGRYVARYSIAEYDEDTDGETNDYDAETDTHYAREGWHEVPVEGEQYYIVAEKVTHWQMLPETPEQETLRFPVQRTTPEASENVAEAPSPKYAMVPTEPDVALLASMATCLNHGFGMLDGGEQERMLSDMRKIHDEVVGRGYYHERSKSRYLDYLAKTHGGYRERDPMAAVIEHYVALNPGVDMTAIVPNPGIKVFFVDDAGTRRQAARFVSSYHELEFDISLPDGNPFTVKAALANDAGLFSQETIDAALSHLDQEASFHFPERSGEVVLSFEGADPNVAYTLADLRAMSMKLDR
jgi:hypothetical protein